MILHVGGKQPNDQLNQNKMKTITSLVQVKEIASAMFSSDPSIISVNIETSFGLVAAFRDGSVRMAEFAWFVTVHEPFPESLWLIGDSNTPTIIRPLIIVP